MDLETSGVDVVSESEQRGAEGPEFAGGSGGMLPRKIFKNECSIMHSGAI